MVISNLLVCDFQYKYLRGISFLSKADLRFKAVLYFADIFHKNINIGIICKLGSI